MVQEDPYTPEQKRFECRDCEYGVTKSTHQPTCPRCGGVVHGAASPRE